jgi:hypothetical protein
VGCGLLDDLRETSIRYCGFGGVEVGGVAGGALAGAGAADGAGCVGAAAAGGAGDFGSASLWLTSSTSKTRLALGGIPGGFPLAP